MNYAERSFDVNDKHPARWASLFAGWSTRMKGIEPMILAWWCLALSIFSSTVARFSTESLGLPHYAMVALGSGGCAWFWLLSRTLFNSQQGLKSGVFAWVAAVVVIEAAAALMFYVQAGGAVSEISRVLDNTAAMVCIATIVFVGYEVLNGYNKIRSATERRFRIIFLGGYSLVIAIAVLWVSGAENQTFAGEWYSVLLTACAATGLIGSRAAVQYRLSTLQKKSAACKQGQTAATDHDDSAQLAQKILNGISNDALLTTANLKVSAFADQIGTQEYKVTRCITNHLQYRNFNHFLNSHRIERAKRLFNDPDKRHLTIASIAYDCGFNSLGPFNRAFKQHTGMTPREFRRR